MVFEILFLIFGVCYYIGKDAKYKQKIKEHDETGWYIESNPELEHKLYYDYCYNYLYGDKSCIEKKYWNYFKLHQHQLFKYCMSLAERDVWKQGYRPDLFSFMPKEGYDFLAWFRDKYDKYAEESNRIWNKLDDEEK